MGPCWFISLVDCPLDNEFISSTSYYQQQVREITSKTIYIDLFQMLNIFSIRVAVKKTLILSAYVIKFILLYIRFVCKTQNRREWTTHL